MKHSQGIPSRTGAIIMAAGKGTRLCSKLPKVLHDVAGKSMIDWILGSLSQLNLAHITIVIGHQYELVQEHIEKLNYPNVSTVIQHEQKGTGHAVQVALAPTSTDGEEAEENPLNKLDTLLVINGDCPAISVKSLRSLISKAQHHQAVILTTNVDNPYGYGRIVRTAGHVTGIVEEVVATSTQKQINEINGGIYAFERQPLVKALERIKVNKEKDEIFITDAIAVFAHTPGNISTVLVPEEDISGINDQGQLAYVSSILRARINDQFLKDGVIMTDPSTTYIEPNVVIHPGATIRPNTHLRGTTVIHAEAVVGPDSELINTTVMEGATVTRSVLTDTIVKTKATVGPYAHLRPGTVLEANAKAGGFVEIKKSVIGEGSKVPHLSYIGDSQVGSNVNIGAGTITCNYDGYSKYPTVIGNNVFVGSDTMLIAPVTIGDSAYLAAGSAIAKDVPAGALAIERSQQANKPDWSTRFHANHAQKSPNKT